MNEIKKTEDVAKSITHPEVQFKGYTLEEIRYQRALVMLQKEFCKNKILRNVNTLKKANPLTPQGAASLIPGRMGTLTTKVLSGLNYVDYAMLGFSIFSSVRKVFSFFHKKKK
ncbi:MAG: hypothetical protein HDR88_00485 [Bacteroides sp.]|nr:hypothetical protein [Bacteroides sp.]